MNHKGTVTLTTDRLILRRYRIQDAEDAYRNWMASEEVTRYMMWPPYKSVDDVKSYIQSVIDCYGDDRYEWVIECKENHQAIGSIGAFNLNDTVASAEVGYCLSDRYWRRGIMPEALSAVIRYLFDEIGVNRIEATHDERNPASGRVMEKCGLRYEGTMRQAGHNNQGVCNSVIRAILRDDRS